MQKVISLFGYRGADGYPVPSDLSVLLILAGSAYLLLLAFGIL